MNQAYESGFYMETDLGESFVPFSMVRLIIYEASPVGNKGFIRVDLSGGDVTDNDYLRSSCTEDTHDFYRSITYRYMEWLGNG
jgi:hypothetical protein